MSNIESVDPREAWTQARRERIVEALSELVSPLLGENPHLRISLPRAVLKLEETTGIARTLIIGDLETASDLKMPVDGENIFMKFGHDDGEVILEAQLIENPVQSLD